MRVLVDYRPALRHRTGVGEYVHELVRALTAPGGPMQAAELAVLSVSWKDRVPTSLAQELGGVSVIDRPLPVRPLTWAWNRLGWPPVEWLGGRGFDVVHAAAPVALPSRRAASVLTIHDLHFLRHPERMTAEMRRDFPALVRSHAKRAGAVVVSSAYTAADVRVTLGVDPRRVHLCPPGAPRWAAEVRAARAARAPELILFLGTLDPRKNIGVLLDAYARLRSREPLAPPLVLAGGVPSTAAAWIDRTREPVLAGHVRVTGYVDEPTRRDLFARARMLVMPSLDEGFGLPALEAMACGVPVVISSGGSLPEVAGDAATPVDPTDVDGLAERMAALLDREAAEAATARGLARAATFTWEACAVSVWHAYRSALEAHA